MNDTIVNETPESKANNTLVIGAVIVVLALVGVGAMMMRGSSKTSTTPTTEMATPTEQTSMKASPTTVGMSPAVQGATDSSSDVKIVEVEAGSFYYKPNEIRVKKGEKVKLTLKAVDMMHDLNIDELGVKVPVTRSGNTATVEFTADKVGEFEMYCSVGQHRKNGQVGTLIVE